MPPVEVIDEWIDALIARHTASLTRPEFLKAVRALSARYVERRAVLPERSPLDSAGKRAAFAAFYAPLHFFTTREIVRALGDAAARIHTIVDLGCGTGVAGAAWALACASPATIRGVDANAWALTEARWNWTALGVTGSTHRGDLVTSLATHRPAPGADLTRTVFLCGWSLNELETAARDRALAALTALGRRGARVLVIEPVARSLVPWWDACAVRAGVDGGRSREWRFPPAVPALLANLDEAAGFRRDALTARTLAINLD